MPINDIISMTTYFKANLLAATEKNLSGVQEVAGLINIRWTWFPPGLEPPPPPPFSEGTPSF